MYKACLIVMLFGGWASAQDPAGQPPAVIAEDPALTDALRSAWQSGLPHRELLAQQIVTIATVGSLVEAPEFRSGARAVLRHSDFSRDRTLGEMYLRLVQRPARDQVVAGFNAAGAIAIDGSRQDWPSDAVMTFPKGERSAGAAAAADAPLRSFGVVRGADSLFVYLEHREKPETLPKPVFGVEVARLSDRFRQTAYSVTIQDSQVRFFNHEGQEFVLNEDQPVTHRSIGRSVELRIPLQRFEPDLRSAAVRGFVLDPRAPEEAFKTPWVPCPSGPAYQPTEMLIHFCAGRELPKNASTAVAIAIQEGLLLARSHPDLAAQVQRDALAWMELALDIELRLEFLGRAPVRSMPVVAQMAWSARHIGAAGFETLDAYQQDVVSPQTLANMRGYAEVQGWLKLGTEDVARAIATMMAKEFKVFDYPNDAARGAGAEYSDSRAGAYIIKGERKLLSYRDIGINQRWQLFEEGFGLKGTSGQAAEFQRLLGIAIGIPSLTARHQGADGAAAYSLVYDERKRRWFPVGPPTLADEPKAKLRFIWSKPWIRPERFDFWEDHLEWLPRGPIRLFLDAGSEEMTAKRLDSLFTRGFSNELFAASILQPL